LGQGVLWAKCEIYLVHGRTWRSSRRVVLPVTVMSFLARLPESFAATFASRRYADGLPSAGAALDRLDRQGTTARSRSRLMGQQVGPRLTTYKEADQVGKRDWVLFRSDLRDEDYTDSAPVPQLPESLKSHTSGRRMPSTFLTLADLEQMEGVGPMTWVEASWFQGLCGLMILTNAIIIGLETDFSTPVFFWIEQILLAFFCVELGAKLCRYGCQFFQIEDEWTWNLFDLSIVVSGVFDQWAMPAFKVVCYYISGDRMRGNQMGVILLLMRMARLLRIVRLFRLVRMVRPLFQLAQGVLEALQGMFWVLVFMVMSLYAAAILATRFIGHGVALPADKLEDPEIMKARLLFRDVPTSMFTLFGTMTSWSLSKFVPLFGEMPLLRPLFVLFYVYSAWALVAVMTGVVSENLIALREKTARRDSANSKKKMIHEILLELFRAADTDGSCTISRDEFDQMLKSTDLFHLLTSETRLRPQDLHDLFDWLDHDASGSITIDEFMKGFKWMNDPLDAKSLVKLQERVAFDLSRLQQQTEQLIAQRYQEVDDMVARPIGKVHAIAEQMQNLDMICNSLTFALKEHVLAIPTHTEMVQCEASINKHLDGVVEHLSHLGALCGGGIGLSD